MNIIDFNKFPNVFWRRLGIFSEIEGKQQISEIEGKRKFCENEDRWNSVKLIAGEAAHRGRDGAGQHSLPPGLSFCNQYYGSYLFNVTDLLSV